ncbi:MAG TPA: DJ-1/PfpI family protein [Chitinophagales bacterium]|nr:DJ-1/PfpI family protein [Chitinophagales bacterium]
MHNFAAGKKKEMCTRFAFLVLPEMHLLDLAGPEQVIQSATGYGANYEIMYCGLYTHAASSSGLGMSGLKKFSSVKLQPGDYLIVAGAYTGYLFSKEFKQQQQLFNWIKKQHNTGVNVCSICTGAYVLGYAGLLAGNTCTTHWQLTADMQKRFPTAQVQENILFVANQHLYTSAGIVSGIDMMLAIVEKLNGAYLAHKVARELVIYNRRSGNQAQHSEFVNYRNHIHAGVHAAQDWLHENLHRKVTLPQLATIANMSYRNFTRVFKKETGITVNDYITTLRIERINELMKNPDLSRQQMARRCGLKSERQIARLIQQHKNKVAGGFG